MPYIVTVSEIFQPADQAAELQTIKRYEQTVDVLDLAQLTAMVNRKPRKPREKKAAK